MQTSEKQFVHKIMLGINVMLLCFCAGWAAYLIHSQYQFNRYKEVVLSHNRYHYNDVPMCVKEDRLSLYPTQYYSLEASNEAKLLNKYMDKATIYFEYGADGTTLDALKHKNIKKVYTVENRMEKIGGFLHKYELVRQNEDSGRMTTIFVDTSAVDLNGFPRDRWNNYSAYPQTFMKKNDYMTADLILINGRYRMSSLAMVIMYAKNNPYIAFHNIDRQEYAKAYELLDEVESADWLTIFKIKPNLDKDKVWEIYLRYERDAR